MIQRAFLQWLNENRGRFAIEIKPGRRTDAVLEFAFAGINGAIAGFLSTWEICVVANHEGECWDFLLSLETTPRRVPGGYVCDLCPPESREVFAHRSALWTFELFEPFLDWVNSELAPAKWLALEGEKKQMTRATLTQNAPDPNTSAQRRRVLSPVRLIAG
jgi:hypothetical protein